MTEEGKKLLLPDISGSGRPIFGIETRTRHFEDLVDAFWLARLDRVREPRLSSQDSEKARKRFPSVSRIPTHASGRIIVSSGKHSIGHMPDSTVIGSCSQQRTQLSGKYTAFSNLQSRWVLVTPHDSRRKHFETRDAIKDARLLPYCLEG